MLQDIFSDAIELVFAISTVYFAVGFLLSVASKVTLKVQIVSDNQATLIPPMAPPEESLQTQQTITAPVVSVPPIAYDFTATEAALTEINLLNQVASLPAQVLPSLSAKEADSHLDAQLRNLIHIDQLSAVLKDTTPRTTKSSRSSKAKKQKSRKTAAKAQAKTASISIPVVSTKPKLQINLSQCKTQKLRGVLHIDVNSIPQPLPANIKTYSIQGRFKGVRVPDLEANGFFVVH